MYLCLRQQPSLVSGSSKFSVTLHIYVNLVALNYAYC
jgi:hypothetical protein